jgi:hypothetical protein
MNLAHTYTIDAAADARSLIHPSSVVWHFFLAVTKNLRSLCAAARIEQHVQQAMQ